MRVLVAPDGFGGTLTAPEAARAIVEGWRRHAPDDVLTPAAMSDGGPGFVDVLHAALGGELDAVTVTGPYGDPTPATILRSGDTSYVESAQAVGLHLTEPENREPERATTRGLGELLAMAVDAGATRVVLGLGGSATNDAGAGLLSALGATAEGGSMEEGPARLAEITSVELSGARRRVEGVELVVASDVDNPLLGIKGATKIYGPQKGLTEDRHVTVDAWLQHFAELTDRKVAAAKGAGAAGGLGFALLLLGGTRSSGVDMVMEAVGLAEKVREADLVVTGEGAFDFSSGS
ncbi:MAG: glycerate kinase, partial [Aeromicrobium sp.]